jgi:hypothetical protein
VPYPVLFCFVFNENSISRRIASGRMNEPFCCEIQASRPAPMTQADSFPTLSEAPITGADLRPSTKRSYADRRFIGGSDARIIMGTDEAALLRLWREKRGEVGPTDLSGNLIVQLGLVTEELNRRWYEANTGWIITDVQRQVRHPTVRWMGATRRPHRGERRSVRGQLHAAMVVL